MKDFRELKVLYEDNHLLSVNKPAGVLVQGDKTGDKPLLDFCKDYIKHHYQKPGDVFLGSVHRIDRPVSGAVIFARTSKALERMNKKFQEKEVAKTYYAITAKKPDPISGTLTHWLLKERARNLTIARPKAFDQGIKSILHYQLKGDKQDYYLLEVHPETGRSHQIRAQLSAIGVPILGDLKYGYPSANPDASIGLHAFGLRFEHPVRKEPVKIVAPLPAVPWWQNWPSKLFE
jgi:23S rRNA pseudouridine1911/1915/1917 synthase